MAAAPSIFLTVFAETKSTSLLPAPKVPFILAATQAQLDSTISILDQLILEFEFQVNTLTQLEARHHSLLKISHEGPGNPAVEDELTSIRCGWRASMARCVDLEYCLESAISCLERSLEVAVLVTPLFTSAEDLSMCDRGGHILKNVQDNFEDLRQRRQFLTQALFLSVQMDNLEVAVGELLWARDNWIIEASALSHDILTRDPVEVFRNVNHLEDEMTKLIRATVHASDEKTEQIVNKLAVVVDYVDKLDFSKLSNADKAQAYLLKGKALNVAVPIMEQKRESAAEAKTCLEKALQIDPGLSDAWCELAEHEWMLCEPERAVAPLQTTLKLNVSGIMHASVVIHLIMEAGITGSPKYPVLAGLLVVPCSSIKQNADALWRLSMLLRQLPAESTAKRALFECSELLDLLAPGGSSKDSLSVSLRLAHAAVKADPTSGRAWECLGNALLTAFLSGPPDKTAGFIGRSLAAFTQASKHPSVVAQPHFHYNRAAALHYKDDFSGALVSWLRAGLLDPAWPAPRASATRCLRAFRKMDAIVHTQAEDFDKTTRKRIASLISSLAPCLAADGGQPLAKLLGPFRPRKQGSKSAAVTSTIPDLEFRLFKDLKTGNNFGKVVCGGVVTSLPSDSDLALNLLLVDAEGSFLVLRIHQISKVSVGCLTTCHEHSDLIRNKLLQV
ncbi:unnamed protein product [Mesocestoides corti]|uniref:Tetratricopeptide repeat protein 5 OB fold domain-containing protein n=1 Tax=Mesocestoides corti TaxID=53468 RepID=A0A0R3UM63_MESCO|nr:unnamed protein product [Mesocestoides corti]